MKAKRISQIGLFGGLALLLSGCFLRSLLGFVDPGGEPGEWFVVFSANSLSATCAPPPEDGGIFLCQYRISSEGGDSDNVISTGLLLHQFGLFGALVDPVIVQVPEDADNLGGQFQGGPQPEPLLMTVTDTFNVQPGKVVSAEPGHKFVILEFPPHVPPTLPEGDPATGAEYDFDFYFSVPDLAPVDLKVMMAVRVDSHGKAFYLPMVPCVTDFASVPTLQIPVSPGPVNLLPQLHSVLDQGSAQPCDGQVYDFTTGGFLHLPVIRRQ